MTDFDPDSYLSSSEGSAPFDPDAHLTAASPPVAARPKTPLQDEVDNGSFITPATDAYLHQVASSLGHSIVGGYKGLTTRLTGGSADEAADAVNAELAKTYQAPQGIAKTVMESKLNPLNYPQEAGDYLADRAADAGLSPGVSTTLKTAPAAITSALGLRSIPAREATVAPIEDTQAILNKNYAAQSMGAAASAPNISSASPALRSAISKVTQSTGGAVNPDALTRHMEADSLTIPVQLSRGQALQDPAAISNEMNLRGKDPQGAAFYNNQNQNLIENLRDVREKVGPDVFTSNSTEHGQALIDAYKSKGDAADADVNAKYQALRDAAGGNFPVDAGKLLTNASSALHDSLLYDHAPKAVMNTLGRLSDNDNMTFENFESLRTNLARIQRSSQDGNEVAAAGVIRNAMEDLPLSPGASKLKPLADQARSAARTQFQALEADPAYKAAVNDRISPDQFVQRFITGTGASASQKQVATMRANLADNPIAQQTMGVAAIDHLRDSAGVDVLGNGNFSQANFNKRLDQARPKLGNLVQPDQAYQLDTLGKVARYTQAQPRGSFVNNSNTLVGALAGEGASALEHATNAVGVAKTGLPLGSLANKMLKSRALKSELERAFEPGAGLADLPVARPRGPLPAQMPGATPH